MRRSALMRDTRQDVCCTLYRSFKTTVKAWAVRRIKTSHIVSTIYSVLWLAVYIAKCKCSRRYRSTCNDSSDVFKCFIGIVKAPVPVITTPSPLLYSFLSCLKCFTSNLPATRRHQHASLLFPRPLTCMISTFAVASFH